MSINLSKSRFYEYSPAEHVDYLLNKRGWKNNLSSEQLVKVYENTLADIVKLEKKIEKKQRKFSKLCKNQPTNASNLVLHISEMRKIWISKSSEIPLGFQKGGQVLKLQKELCKRKDIEKRKIISKQIVSYFESCTTYQELYDLRSYVDKKRIGTSNLHKLLYEEVDVESCHKIIEIINESARVAYEIDPTQIRFRYMIYSDIDDTIKGSLNDRATHIHKFYPSVMKLYHHIGQAQSPSFNKIKSVHDADSNRQISLTFLSARVKSFERLWNKKMKKDLSKDMKFYALYGSKKGFLAALKFYVLKKFASAAKPLLSTSLKEKINDYLSYSQLKTFTTLALSKKQNIERDLLLRPETLPIFVGDCGEGDLLFLLIKNSQLPSIHLDERIPIKYQGTEKWTGSFETPVNPINKPLFMSFIHILTGQKKSDVGNKFSREDCELNYNVILFNNYIEIAQICLKKGIIDDESFMQIVEDSNQWLLKQQKKTIRQLKKQKLSTVEINNMVGDELNELAPHLQYRLQLSHAIYQSKMNASANK